MMKRFCAYIEKVFDFSRQIRTLQDARKRPRIPTLAIWGSAFFLFVMRHRSLHAMEQDLQQPKRVERVIGKIKSSADRIGDVMGLIEPELFRKMLSQINHRLGRNKALRNDWPFRVAVFDGHEFFSSRCRCCSQCCQRTVKADGKEVIEYYHRGVVFHLVGFPIAMPLDVEMIQPGEGEVVVAKRLLERVLPHYGRFFDVVMADAIYLEASFYNLCLQHHKHVISVLKGDQRLLLQDAQGVFSLMEPKVWKEHNAQSRVEIRAWDAEGFTTAEGINVALRVLHTKEALTQRHRKNHRWVEETEVRSWWWATTISMSQMSTRWFWHIAHRRWEIENNLLHTLVTYWALDHCFKHHPTAILNFVLTLFIAFVLLQSFYYRNLNPQRRIRLTLIGLTKELHLGLITMDIAAPWVCWRGG